MLEFYIAKIESYMRRKHESIYKNNDIEISSSGDTIDETGSTNGSSQAILDLEKLPTEEKKVFEYKVKIPQAQDDDEFDR